MQYINLYFQVHQPRRLSKFRFFDIGSDKSYFNDSLNEGIMKKIAHDCYLPTNKLLLKLIKKFPQIRLTFSITGIALEQLSAYAPAVIDSFKSLAKTGAVEFLGEPYYHSLSSLKEPDEFAMQVEKHRNMMIGLFEINPVIFRNTELIYSNAIGKMVHNLGFKGMYFDGSKWALRGKSVNKTYLQPGSNFVLFPRNFTLSDDIAFRYSDKSWSQWPLTADKFMSWLNTIPMGQDFISIGMDYETFGEHHKATGGIFKFLEQFIASVAASKRFKFITPSKALQRIVPQGELTSDYPTSWADQAKDVSAWLGNDLQRDAYDSLLKLHPAILESNNNEFIATYGYLQTSDHFYYMSTKKSEDGNVHQYFSPYASPYEAYMNYMNVLADLEMKLISTITSKSSDAIDTLTIIT